MKNPGNNSFIHVLHDLHDNIRTDGREKDAWIFRSFYSDCLLPDNLFSPNRRDFYQIMLITGGAGMLIIGANTYRIEQSVMLFIHPNEITSWKDLTIKSGAHYVLFKKAFLVRYPQLKVLLDKFGLFQEKKKNVICIDDNNAHSLCQYFEKMALEECFCNVYYEDTMQALLQLLIVESMKAAHFPEHNGISVEYSRISQFFDLLEKEMSGISLTNPIRIRTVKEFAYSLKIHPNYLNVLLKKQTGQNVSTHIRSRLLEEARTLLLHTNWNLQDIAFSMGFSEQSNFHLFFKKNTGVTPAEFRRNCICNRVSLF